MSRGGFFIFLLGSSGLIFALTAVETHAESGRLSERLAGIRGQVMSLQQNLIDGLRSQGQAKVNIRKIQSLLKLQHEEKELGKRRMAEIENTVGELEARRNVLKGRIAIHHQAVKKSLSEIVRSVHENPRSAYMSEEERTDAPRRKVLANLVERELKEIEVLKADMTDADQLEARIQDEKQQLAYLFQDLREQEGVLQLNKQLQVDLLKKHHAERVAQLENYRKLKSAESQVENLMHDFSARKELEQAEETEKVASRAMSQGAFAHLKGKLPLPISGKILTSFGRSFDPKSNLYVFKKGVDIEVGKNQPIHAVSAGKVAFSGELPNYGRVTIVDHGDHFYSLCAHLGELQKKVGDAVAAGDSLGLSDDQGTPVYFEIRSRNVAVNPLQWITN